MTYHYATGHYLPKLPLNIAIILVTVGAVFFSPHTYATPHAATADTATVRQDTLAIEEIQINTGYQRIPKERATGSFVFVDSTLLNRRVSANLIDRLEGVVSGLVFNRNISTLENESPLSIRGRSTLFANTAPLIVIDNFPYEGDLNTINPNDVASITVLKDAAAASIWGARSGNGVIVITTKSGGVGTKPVVNANSNITLHQRPNLHYQPQVGNIDYIELQRYLYEQGYYNTAINRTPQSALPPAVSIFLAENQGRITSADAADQLATLAGQDILRDLDTYFYQPALHQQYHASVASGSPYIRYYFSAGYDGQRSELVRNGNARFTLNNNTTFTIIPERLSVQTNLVFAHSNQRLHNDLSGFRREHPYPYLRIADGQGNALPLSVTHGRAYTDTVGAGLLQDWLYRPLDELHMADNTTRSTDFRVNTSVDYRIVPGLRARISYQYFRGSETGINLHAADSYYARDLVNQFTQLDATYRRILAQPIPPGGIRDENHRTYFSHHARGQLDYQREWADRHQLVALAGLDVSDQRTDISGFRFYGYDELNATSRAVDVANYYPTLPFGNQRLIPDGRTTRFLVDRYVSLFGNASYTLNRRYTATASIRKDESNLFGVRSNQRGVPLWSVGGAWRVTEESFISVPWLSQLTLRATYGINGNVDKSVSAYPTASGGTIANPYGVPYYMMINPPNDDLRWERIAITNIGIDFNLLAGRISGTVELYRKDGKDLIGSSPTAPSTGITQFRGNHANLTTKGVDLTLHTVNLRGPLQWTTDLLASYAADRVTRYLAPPTLLNAYLRHGYSYPREGYPYHAVFALPWAGLSPEEGAPMGYVDGEPSTGYARLMAVADEDELIYFGPGRPTHFGALRNTLHWQEWELSVNVTYKLGYYYSAPATRYQELYAGTATMPGYARRWQQAGDELRTYVPARYYPVNTNREDFYRYAEVHVKKGDHLRLQDIQLAYTLHRARASFAKKVRIYGYASNLGTLWKSTSSALDPDYLTATFPPSLAVSIGLQLGF